VGRIITKISEGWKVFGKGVCWPTWLGLQSSFRLLCIMCKAWSITVRAWEIQCRTRCLIIFATVILSLYTQKFLSQCHSLNKFFPSMS